MVVEGKFMHGALHGNALAQAVELAIFHAFAVRGQTGDGRTCHTGGEGKGQGRGGARAYFGRYASGWGQ